ncbi:nucleotide disphospho-sugar-binding domain-containing protein [Kitasatospora sp. NPDC049258]|uniref:nucleotide disphospho-sugar-binding domain-containing protein n=1 Tax=Kitasatospora sp. NPDC049258 TaxID=3155394 RepID=UPI00342CFE7A
MRVLFTGPGAAGHVFPMVPTAQALRAAGHQVLFAGASPIDVLRGTGLPVADVGDGSTVLDGFRRAAELEPGWGEPQYVAEGRSHEESIRLAVLGFAEHGRSAVPGLLRLAEAWRPDLLVHAAFQAAGPVVAAALGIPSVVHNFGVMPTLEVVDRMAGHLGDLYEAHGLPVGPGRRTVLDVVPAVLGGSGGGLRVRYVPYNGAGEVPPDLAGRSGRRRIAVTLGTVLTEVDGVRAITGLVRQAARVDADFLLAVGGADLGALGELPDNVRPLPWVPLAELLDASDAIVHHGGSGTMLTAAVAGVPQLLLPQGADHFTNADAAETLGFALRSTGEGVDAELLERLLTDEGLQKAATTVRAQIAELPTPAELVAELEAVVRR